MKSDDNLLDAAAKVFRDRLSSGSRFRALLEGATPDRPIAVGAAIHESPAFTMLEKGDLHLPATLRLARSVESPARQIGDMPPEPPTLRGRIGSILVQTVRRALFWYTGQIRALHGMVADAAREQTQVLQDLDGRQQRQQALLADVLTRMNEHQREHEQRQLEFVRAHEQRSKTLDEQITRQERLVQQLRELQEAWRNEFDRKLIALEQNRTAADEQEKTRRAALAGRLAQMDETFAAIKRDIQHERAHLQQQEFRLKMLLREVRKTSFPESGSSAVGAIAEDMEQANDALFVDHAQAFRGERSEIKSRFTVYEPHLKEAFSATAGAPVLDLGCGRGEWLELMRDWNIPASGIDSNHELVQMCCDMSLDVRHGHLPRILSSIPDESLSAVTAFHVLEHVSFADLLEIIDHAVRILKPGGIAIFETPNPKNMFVGANHFYLDPTHRHPIPSELLAFIVETRGLCDPTVLALSPYPDYFRLTGPECPAVQFINDHFFGAQDYGIVAHKV